MKPPPAPEPEPKAEPAPKAAPAPKAEAPAPEQPPAAAAASAAEPSREKAELESIDLEGGELDPAPLGASTENNAAPAPAEASQSKKKRKRDPALNREWRKLKALYDEASGARACQKQGVARFCDRYHLLRSDISKADASDPEKTSELINRVRALTGDFESSRSRW